MTLNKYLWILPFLSFFSGYFIISIITNHQPVKTPLLVGQDLATAVKRASALNLNIRIINQKEDDDLPNNTIIQQTPPENQVIKENQSIFCIVSKKIEQIRVPDFLGKTEQEVNEIIKNKKLKAILYNIQSNEKNNYCIGQFPKSGQLTNQKPLTVYIAHDSNHLVVFPLFHYKPIKDVHSYLESYGLKAHIIHAKEIDKDHTCDQCKIIDQKPLAGTVIDLKKPCIVQLVC